MSKIATIVKNAGDKSNLFVKEYSYSYVTHTGATGTYEAGDYIPYGAEILGVFVHDEITPVTSTSGATIALKMECGSTDVLILVATGLGSAPWVGNGGFVATIANQSNVLPDDGYFVMTIATDSLQAGKLHFYVLYKY